MFIGLWLNRDRAIARQSIAVNQGVRSAMPYFLGKMPDEWFHLVCDTEDEAKVQIEAQGKRVQ